jgi:hypothetical protein
MPLHQRHVSVHAILSVALRRSGRLESGFLSWGSSKIAPPPMKTMRVHSRVRRPFGTKMPISARVPPLPFHPAPTVYSAHGPAGLLHPATGHGVRHISGTLPPRRPKTTAWLPHRDPKTPGRLLPRSPKTPRSHAPSQMALTPFEAFPFATAAPRHRGRCPLAVTPAFRSLSVRASTAFR